MFYKKIFSNLTENHLCWGLQLKKRLYEIVEML